MKRKSILTTMGTLVLAGGCAVNMAAPKGLTGAGDKLAVEGSWQGFSPGIQANPWATADLDRDWTVTEKSSSSASFAFLTWGRDEKTATQRYRFSVQREGQAVWKSECLTRKIEVSDETLFSETSEKVADLGCELKAVGGGASAQLKVATQKIGDSGTLVIGDRSFTIHAGTTLESGSTAYTPLGYLIRRGADVIAAVQTVNTPRIWLKEDLSTEDKGMLLAALASIGLHQELN